jgi:hypothetical protein
MVVIVISMVVFNVLDLVKQTYIVIQSEIYVIRGIHKSCLSQIDNHIIFTYNIHLNYKLEKSIPCLIHSVMKCAVSGNAYTHWRKPLTFHKSLTNFIT